MANVGVYLDNRLDAAQILEFGFQHVVIATGSYWRRDGVARRHLQPMPVDNAMEILTPDDVLGGRRPRGEQVLLYDDDHYYLGGVLAELLTTEGFNVTLVTPAADVSNWTHATMEQHRIQKKLLELGVTLMPQVYVAELSDAYALIRCVFTEREQTVPCDSTLLVTARLPDETLALELETQRGHWQAAGLLSVTAIGDACAPATIAHAVCAGRRYAEQMDSMDNGDSLPFRREITALAAL
jgi:dimethylamine/trimethylamine dehydrogenase